MIAVCTNNGLKHGWSDDRNPSRPSQALGAQQQITPNRLIEILDELILKHPQPKTPTLSQHLKNYVHKSL